MRVHQFNPQKNRIAVGDPCDTVNFGLRQLAVAGLSRTIQKGGLMRGLAYSIACLALFAGTAAHAQSLAITGVKSGSITSGQISAPIANGQLTDDDNALGVGYGGSTETKVNITALSASFESGVATSGPAASATSNSGLDITIQNTTDNQILTIGQFGSTIVPAGMGFYMQDRTGSAAGNNIYTGYGQSDVASLQDLWPSVGAGVFAYSSFDFTVVSNDVTLYSLSGYLSLSFDERGQLQRNYGLTDAAIAMPSLTTAYDNDVAYAYAWDATDIAFDLNAVIGPGGSQTLFYRTTVNSYTTAACLNATTCLVAYSGFGDPIGRGGGISFAERSAASANGDRITGIGFEQTAVERFELIDAKLTGAIPEPSTWAMLIMGFGLLGAALRRRRLLAYS